MSNQPANVSARVSGEVIDLLNKIPIVRDMLYEVLQSSNVQFFVRKSAHMIIFCLLAMFCFMVVYEVKRCYNKASVVSFLITFLYACFDEMHQLFVPGRGGQVRDVVIDCVGAVIGLVVINVIVRSKDIMEIKNKYTS